MLILTKEVIEKFTKLNTKSMSSITKDNNGNSHFIKIYDDCLKTRKNKFFFKLMLVVLPTCNF